MATSIIAENISKQYKIGRLGYNTTFREAIANIAKCSPWKKPSKNGTIWALKNISFSIKKGEVVGIIGRNGAGKSTLLKILSGVTPSTVGSYHLNGRFVPLIEVGAGFHPELTGRQNIFLNGALLGLSRQEIQQKFDAIVSFSGLEEFIDTPVKRYSSGMFVRLGFSVSIHTNPEILLVDEVLAVGDLAFVLNCYSEIMRLKDRGTAIVMVTHNLDILRHMATTAMILEKGTCLEWSSDVFHVCNRYRDRMLEMTTHGAGQRVQNDSHCWIKQVRLNGGSSASAATFPCDAPFHLDIEIESTRATKELYLLVGFFHGESHQLLSNLSMFQDQIPCEAFQESGSRTIGLTIPTLPLHPGSYLISLQLVEENPMKVLDWHERMYRFSLVGNRHNMGPLALEHQWILPETSSNSAS